MGKRNDPAWRDHAASSLLLDSLDPGLGEWLPGPVLLVGEPLCSTLDGLEARGLPMKCWNRRYGPLGPGLAWPPLGPHQAALVRLPRSVDELKMTAYAVRVATAEGAPILLYGAKDEGIESAPGRLEAVWGQGRKVAVGGHCRVIRFDSPVGVLEEGTNVEAWRTVCPPPLATARSEWVSYPGVFGHRPLARGLLDPGTQALLDALPEPPPGLRVLDYGAGAGPVAAWILNAQPDCHLHLIDIDAVALEAARENVPEAEDLVMGDKVPPGPWDWVVSNPPFHEGKAHTLEILERLIRDAGAALARSGRLFFVTQRRLPVERLLRERFRTQDILLDRGPFRVWSAGGPQVGG